MRVGQQLLARFVRRYSGISYRKFYEDLQNWILEHPKSLLGAEYKKMRASWEEYFVTGRQGPNAYRFGDLQIQGYMQIHGTQYALRAQHSVAKENVTAFFQHFDHGLDDILAQDIVKFQDAYVTQFGRPFKFTHEARCNVWEFVRGEEELAWFRTKYEFEVTEPYDRTDIDDFLNKTYFRRRAGFGKMRVKSERAALASISADLKSVV